MVTQQRRNNMSTLVKASWVKSLEKLSSKELVDMAQMIAQNKRAFTDEAQLEMRVKYEYIRKELKSRTKPVIIPWNEI